MVFDKSFFIKPNVEFDSKREDYAPMFRKVFSVSENVKSAVLSVCGLGYGYYYLNGKKVTDDLFTAPVSDYNKTLWYNSYDVSPLIKKGENIFSVVCGNGWYNEGLETGWDFNKASWRDLPKFILSLEINGKTALVSDDSWRYTLKTPWTFNQLRQGEHYDSRKYNPCWVDLGFDDSLWEGAKIDDCPPKGVFKECLCEPIREFEEFKPVNIMKLADDNYLFDFGENISGYVRLFVNQPEGDKIVLKYAEEINDDNSLKLNDMDNPLFYKRGIFQVDEFICCGKEFTWTPKFAYHGFRYCLAEGLKNANEKSLTAVFVHQAVERRSDFNCSNSLLNRLFYAGIRATYSNMFYMPTDCPTREKLGWLNDAQASCEQFLTDFKLEKVLSKWWEDICDAMKENGALPGIVPTSGWGYTWGNGLASEGALFEIPYRIFMHTNDDTLLIKGIPYFKKSIEFFNSNKDENGDITYGLFDWAPPDRSKEYVDEKFINLILKIKCERILKLALQRSGESYSDIENEIKADEKRVKEIYLTKDGTSSVNKQTAVSMLIYFNLYDDIEPLKEQLKALIKENDFHHDCGMVGIRYLYEALNICNLPEYAYKIITANGFPSYSDWIYDGATSLYEQWNKTQSKNHHMYSDFMCWLIKTILGINMKKDGVAYKEVDIAPVFFEDLEYANGFINTVKGKISVDWKKNNEFIDLIINVPSGITAFYKGKLLNEGKNELKIKRSK